jgi:hypothetical protein
MVGRGEPGSLFCWAEGTGLFTARGTDNVIGEISERFCLRVGEAGGEAGETAASFRLGEDESAWGTETVLKSDGLVSGD